MIVKNGEILAIDHIAHDNTLSGNGTSAKPVGLSQSTKDLIDSKVKKTDFETYKSSVANQIRDINNTIAADESSLESYKETVAASFTTVNDRITDVANAKQDKGNYVSATNFNDFKNTVESQIEALDTGKQPVGDYVVTNDFNSYKETVDGKFTTVNERITNVANAKQDKGDYVSASDFNTYKTNVAGEIARVDGRIDTTSANLENNYYKKNQTYSQSEVDEIVSKLGAYVYVENVTPEGYPIVDEPSSKVIYLTQIPNETQCLQWIWLETQEWKCIGDTTMNLSAYATKEWTNNNFETIDQFNTAIANYYTKGEVNAELATKVDNDDFNAYKTEVNGKFATKQSLTDTKAELEDTIESVSGEIINKVNTDYRVLDGEIDAIATTLSNDYYTSLEIDAILAASGEYYTKTESDTKYAEKEVFNTAINELSLNKLDKSATANWDVTEYTEGENIKIIGHEISGKDWSNEIADAVENKVDESELENYVTKTDFNILDNEVGLIDNDLDTLSGKTVSVIKDSETVKAIRSTEPDGTISYTLSAHDGKQADYLWKPTVNAAGNISWELALTGDTPDPANIKGPQGIQGISGTPGKDGITPKLKIDENDIWNVSYDNEATWTSLGVSATGPKGETGAQGPQGIQGIQGVSGTPGKDGVDGKDGQNGISLSATSQELTNKTQVQIGQVNGPVQTTFDLPWGQDGISPTVTTNTLPPDEQQAEGHINGGVKVTITDKTGDHEYTAWNGNNGTMAGAPTITGYDGIVANLNGTQYEVGLSSEYKAAIESISADYLTKTDAGNTYQPKGSYVTTADILTADSNKLTGIKIGNTDYTIQETNWTTTIQTASAKAYNDATANANELYVTKASAHNEFVNTSSWANTAFQPKGNYVATADLLINASNQLTGIKIDNSTNYPIPLFGGVTADNITITGDGNTNPLGVAWSALSGYTITSALNAGSASYAVALGTTASYSALSDIAGAINAKTDKPADMTSNTPYCFSAGQWADMTQTYYSKTEATGTFLQKNLTNTLSGDGTSSNKLGVNWSNLSGNTITSALSAGSATSAYSASYATTAASAYINASTTSAMSDIVDELHGKLDLTGGTVSGQVTISGSNFDNNLHLKCDNNNGFIGLANNGAITIKNVISNSTSQIEFLTSANKTFDITVKDNSSTPQPTGKLYVMSAHSLADAAATSANWANDGMLHIILES